MTPGLSDWMAGVREYRLATISAIAALLLLVLLLVAPSRFLPKQIHVVNKASQAKTATYGLSAKPARNSANESKTKQAPTPHIVKKRPVPKREKTTSGKTASRHHATPVANHHVRVGNRLKYGYYVQAGAFRDIIRANRLARLLQRSGWHAQIISKRHNLHAVLAGPLNTRTKAKNAKSKLARQSGIRGFIIFMAPRN